MNRKCGARKPYPIARERADRAKHVRALLDHVRDCHAAIEAADRFFERLKLNGHKGRLYVLEGSALEEYEERHKACGDVSE